MIKKICPSCEQPSYSASEHSYWICPHCGTDMKETKPALTEVVTDCFWCGDRVIRLKSGKCVCQCCGQAIDWSDEP